MCMKFRIDTFKPITMTDLDLLLEFGNKIKLQCGQDEYKGQIPEERGANSIHLMMVANGRDYYLEGKSHNQVYARKTWAGRIEVKGKNFHLFISK